MRYDNNFSAVGLKIIQIQKIAIRGEQSLSTVAHWTYQSQDVRHDRFQVSIRQKSRSTVLAVNY